MRPFAAGGQVGTCAAGGGDALTCPEPALRRSLKDAFCVWWGTYMFLPTIRKRLIRSEEATPY